MRTFRSRQLTWGALLATTAIAMPFGATQALAQGASDANDNEIIVTAQRRSEALEDVPMSITAVSPETLASAGINTIRDLQNITSGFQLNNSGTYPQPAIRGVTTANSGSYENNVALWVDGLYEITPQILNMDLPNVQSIEVLKGPQGALYGRNATGGAILINTLDPTDHYTGMLEGTVGRFFDRRLRGYIAGPLSDKIGFSLAATYRQTDGYYKVVSVNNPNTFNGRGLGLNQESVRAKIVAHLTDTFKATVAYNFIRAKDPRGVFFTPFENLTAGFAPRQLGEVAGDAFQLDLKQHEASLKLELETGIGTLRSVTGYQHSILDTTYDSDGRYSAAGISPTDSISDSRILDNTWQENLDFTINAIDRLDLIIGATYFHNEEHYAPGRENANYSFPNSDPTATAGTPFSRYLLSQTSGSERTKQAWAGFVDATFHATDRLTINVGGRYSTETQNIAAQKYNFCKLASCNLIPGPGTVGLGQRYQTVYDAAASSTYSKFTPRANIRYEISPRTNVYFSYSQGFKAGEWNGVIPGDNPALWRAKGQIGQETIDAFEVGIKGATHRLRFDLAGFLYNYHNIQVSSVQFVNGVTSVVLQSLPKARIYGVEGNIDYDVNDNLKIRAGATWLHARYGEGAFYQGIGVNGAGAASGTPLTALPNTSVVFPLWQDLSGLQMNRAPDFSGYVGFEYNVPHGEGGVRFAANLKYTSSYVVTDPAIWGGESPTAFTARTGLPAPTVEHPSNNNAQLNGTPYVGSSGVERARQGAYALVNASVTWTDDTGHMYVRLWGNNITNVLYKVHYRPSSRTYAPIGEPATYGVTIGVKFGG